MKRFLIIFLAGFILALGAYFLAYAAGMGRSRQSPPDQMPELGWLRTEFQLNDAEFQRICDLHRQYLAGCAERCRKIDEKNAELTRLLRETNSITSEIERILHEAAALRADCQKQMLQHCYDVSKTMPAEQGKRYLVFVQQQTIHSDTHSQMSHAVESSQHHH